MKVAAVHSFSRAGAYALNLIEVESILIALQQDEVEFALFPELNISGYTSDKQTVDKLLGGWEDVELALCRFSSDYNISFTAGFPERENGKYYITNYLFTAGVIVGKHRKTHLGPGESKFYSSGSSIAVYENSNWQIGMQICFESHFPEISAAYSKMGASLLTFSFASPRENADEKMERFNRFLPARAYDNGCFVMACNQSGISQSGKPFAGVATIIDAKGKTMVASTGDISGYCIADLNLDEITKIKASKMGDFNAFKNYKLIKSLYEI